ncbi:MAG: ribonuclease J [Candidatus Shapirobacteria bacterium]|nr:ribonuclease J [Candidatus Shapirobacteria bacterium]MDD5073686.1 ribonuclease J [Candidatus Shapirobacteria bacterium]MDD5481448.1 ribonuclease J [Candidatus Shapirobacteria bacterium]
MNSDNSRTDQLKIVSLGGFGLVTKNMFVYETPKDIIIVDCGIGFPDEEMLGVDLVIPDISYLKDKKDKIRGIVISHGHEDHFGALPFLLPLLPKVPIFSSKLALAIAERKLKENRIRADLRVADRTKPLKLGDFEINFIQVTHSVPETQHMFIKTPYGNVYHGSDFKFDWTPIDKSKIEVKKMVEASHEGVDLMLSDCLRSEREGYTESEQTLVEIFEREIAKARGRFIVTTMSSNISRLKTAIDVSLARGRKVALAGRSIIEVVKIGREFGYLNLPKDMEVDVRKIANYPDDKITLLVAGSQAQSGSSLDRIASQTHDNIRIKPGDFVVFSTDYIPGNESSIQTVIDLLMRQGAEVSYMDISEDLHVSGHGARGDLALLINLVKPKFLLPIGGGFRQMKQYSLLAQRIGYQEDKVLLPSSGDVIGLANQEAKIIGRFEARDVMVDGLGVGDVGNVVLRDREILSREGVVSAVVMLDKNKMQTIQEPAVLSRGFVYGQIRDGKEILLLAQKEISRIINGAQKGSGVRDLKVAIQDSLEKFFYRTTGRRPMVLLTIIEI